MRFRRCPGLKAQPPYPESVCTQIAYTQSGSCVAFNESLQRRTAPVEFVNPPGGIISGGPSAEQAALRAEFEAQEKADGASAQYIKDRKVSDDATGLPDYRSGRH